MVNAISHSVQHIPDSTRPRWTLSGLKLLRWEIISRGKTLPSVYMPLVGNRSKDVAGEFRGLNRETELLIDAFPRSANSFATFAFIQCQTKPVRLSHHLHAPASMIYAARNAVPALTILREPFAACTSLLSYFPQLGVKQAFTDYVRYYDAVHKYVDGIVVVKFETVTRDMGTVIEAVNERFSTSFEVFAHNDENISKVQHQLNMRAAQRFGAKAHDHGRNSTPSAAAASNKQAIGEYLNSLSEQSILKRASELYETISARISV